MACESSAADAHRIRLGQPRDLSVWPQSGHQGSADRSACMQACTRRRRQSACTRSRRGSTSASSSASTPVASRRRPRSSPASTTPLQTLSWPLSSASAPPPAYVQAASHAFHAYHTRRCTIKCCRAAAAHRRFALTGGHSWPSSTSSHWLHDADTEAKWPQSCTSAVVLHVLAPHTCVIVVHHAIRAS